MPGRGQNKRFEDPYDRVLGFGDPHARKRGQQLNALAKDKVKDLIPDGPYVYDFTDLVVPKIVGGVVVPATTIVRTVRVSGVTADNTYVSYVFTPGPNTWVEVDPVIHQPTALVGVLRAEYKKVSTERDDLKQELSNLKLELSLLRHDYERVKPKEIRARRWSYTALFTLFFLLGLLLADVTQASQPVCTIVNEEAKTCEQWEWEEATPTYLESIVQQFRGYWEVSRVSDALRYCVPYLYDWHVMAAVLAVVYSLWADRSIPMLVTLVLATVTRMQVLVLAITPLLDAAATFSLWAVMVLYTIDQPAAIVLSFVLLTMASIYGLIASDVDYAAMVRGHLCVLALAIMAHIVHVTRTPQGFVIAFLVTCRLLRALSLVMGERVEVRGPDGKVLETRTNTPAWLSKVSGIRKFFQVRTAVSPTARVVPNGVALVESKDGVGTGFRAKNYILTANHVVGSDEMVRITWGGVNAHAKVIERHPTKDVCFLSLPQELQAMPVYRLAKCIKDGSIVITTLDDGGVLGVAVSEGVVVGDNMTYAIRTKNGMSGAPVTDTDGRLIGVHQTNTGFTGGAVIVVDADFPGPKKSSREQQLEEEIIRLKAAMNQSMNVENMVDLVRIAVEREMTVLRQELARGYDQAKGKNKKHHTKGKRRRAFTEEEYKELLEKGFSRNQLRAMADAILDSVAGDDDYETAGEEAEPAGYPEWSDHDSASEIEDEWYQQSWKECEPVSDKPVDTQAFHVADKYGLDLYVITADEMRKVGKDVMAYRKHLEALITNHIEQGKWKPDVDAKQVLEELHTMWCNLNHLMWEHGIVPFTQRKKRQPKNAKRPLRGPN
ncbi:ORF1a [Feline astrovirus 3]|nr:ORF1a [Feline astrovirus 3]